MRLAIALVAIASFTGASSAQEIVTDKQRLRLVSAGVIDLTAYGPDWKSPYMDVYCSKGGGAIAAVTRRAIALNGATSTFAHGHTLKRPGSDDALILKPETQYLLAHNLIAPGADPMIFNRAISEALAKARGECGF